MPITTLTITCPIDGLAVFVISLDWKRNDAEDQAIHMHIPVVATAQCLTGHQWRINGDLVMERVS